MIKDFKIAGIETKKEFGGKDIDNANDAQEAWDAWSNLGRPNVK